jgi:ribose transport system ATP-binding protein
MITGEAVDVTVRYGGVPALRDVSIALAGGSVHALVGENGAGKSTLMKVLAGAIVPDHGTITLDAATQRWGSPKDAQRAGVRMIQQELSLVPALTVAENIALGRETTRYGIVNRRAMRESAVELLGQLGEPIDPDAPVESLALAYRQIVEIAKALAADGRSPLRILILDEPTAILSGRETDALFARLTALRDAGVAILYCSHRLEEIERIADEVTVLRDGQRVGGGPANAMPKDVLIPLMVGRPIAPEHARAAVPSGDAAPVLSVSGLSTATVHDATFALRPGEVVGLVGLIGAGRSELALALMGAVRWTAGTVLLDGQPFHPHSPQEAIRSGVGFVPEDRKASALVMQASVRFNTTLAHLDTFARHGVIDREKERVVTGRWMQSLGIATDSTETIVDRLSGGNQQKVVLARWLVPAHSPLKVLMVDEPTRGVDVGARATIYSVLRALAREGTGVLVITSDLPEALELCDRLLVMRAGRIVGDARTAEDVAELMVAG